MTTIAPDHEDKQSSYNFYCHKVHTSFFFFFFFLQLVSDLWNVCPFGGKGIFLGSSLAVFGDTLSTVGVSCHYLMIGSFVLLMSRDLTDSLMQ